MGEVVDIKGRGQLAGYVLVSLGGLHYIGRRRDEGTAFIDPAYEARVKYMINQQTGQFAVIRECTPICGATHFRTLDISKAAFVIDCADMSGREREAWANAIQEAELLIKAMRSAESGIVVANDNLDVREVPPGVDPTDPMGLLRR